MAAEAETGSRAAVTGGTVATPPMWDSTLCMTHWHKPELQTEVDPSGFVIYVNAGYAGIGPVDKIQTCPCPPVKRSGYPSVELPSYSP